MVITFGQARAPFAILFSLPLAAVGGILGLIISGTPVDVNSLIGALMLIDCRYKRYRINRKSATKSGTWYGNKRSLTRSRIHQITPNYYDSYNNNRCYAPTLFGQSQAGSMVSKSSAVVVIGGLAVSTVLTLVVVPVMYELLDKIGRKRRSRRKINTSTETPDI